MIENVKLHHERGFVMGPFRREKHVIYIPGANSGFVCQQDLESLGFTVQTIEPEKPITIGRERFDRACTRAWVPGTRIENWELGSRLWIELKRLQEEDDA